MWFVVAELVVQGSAVARRVKGKNSDSLEGFVTLEAADKVTIRNATGPEIQIPVANIAQRGKLERSMMPEGLAANLTVREFTSLVDYFEARAKK